MYMYSIPLSIFFHRCHCDTSNGETFLFTMKIKLLNSYLNIYYDGTE